MAQSLSSVRDSAAAPAKQQHPLAVLRGELERMRPEFVSILGSERKAIRFGRVVLTAVSLNPDLLEADRRSFFAACMKAAQDDLDPDGRKAALVVQNTKQPDGSYKKLVRYNPMIEGLIDKVYATGRIKRISVQVVKENDFFDYELGDAERILHKPALKNRGDTIGAYSIVELDGGVLSREWMDIDQIRGVMQRSSAKTRDGRVVGPWVSDFDEMARKTVFRRHYKRLPKESLDDDRDLHTLPAGDYEVEPVAEASAADDGALETEQITDASQQEEQAPPAVVIPKAETEKVRAPQDESLD